MPRFIDKAEHEDIIKYYQSGFCIDAIKDCYGVSRTTIRRILEQYGIKNRENINKQHRYTFNENYFDAVDTNNKAYILGLLFADGCNTSNGNNVFIELQASDVGILERIRDELESNCILRLHQLSKKNPNWSDTYMLNFTSAHFSKRLEELGMVPQKSLVLKFPDWINPDLIPSFLRGYFDGDGHIEWKHNKAKFLTIASTNEFCEYVQNYLSSLNIWSRIHYTANREVSTRILQISTKDNIVKFLDLIYKDAELYLHRKYNQYCEIKKEMMSFTE